MAMNRIEAITIIAIAEGKVRGVRFPHSSEMHEASMAVLRLRQEMAGAERERDRYRAKLERKIEGSQLTYNRLLEENRKVEALVDRFSFHVTSESGLPKSRMRKFLVKLENGDYAVDFLNQDGSWRDFGTRVEKWMEIPLDDTKIPDRYEFTVNSRKNRKKRAENAGKRP